MAEEGGRAVSPLTLDGGLIQPLLKADLAESRVAGRNQRALVELGAEVARVWVGDYIAGIVSSGEALTDQFIETELLRTGHFNRAGEFETSTTTAAP